MLGPVELMGRASGSLATGKEAEAGKAERPQQKAKAAPDLEGVFKVWGVCFRLRS